MSAPRSIAIIGGGPAGASAGAELAMAGKDVLLFDEKLAWEKPCGGGVTHKALQRYPFLAEDSDSNPAEPNSVEYCELISPLGRRVRFHLEYPVAIFSRLALNGSLLARAGRAGVDIHQERVTRIERDSGGWRLTTRHHEYVAEYVILAAGARSPFRAQFLSSMSPSDLMVTAGYFIPRHQAAHHPCVMRIQFLKQITGYIWVFPRCDHVSAGIAGKMGETSTAELRHILERWLEKDWLYNHRLDDDSVGECGKTDYLDKDYTNTHLCSQESPGENHPAREYSFSLEGATFYSHILPSFRPQTFETLKVCGEAWAMLGDSAGLVDPITGEGLYYALRSAELCAEALLAGRPDEYQSRLEEEVLPELRLAARLSRRFYGGQVFGESILERMVSLTAQSASVRSLMSDLFAGSQGYCNLRARLYRILPTVMAECLAAKLRAPWKFGSRSASEFTCD
jgi:flavin-dependent dehydrogenase